MPGEYHYSPNNFAHDGIKKNTSAFCLQKLSNTQEN